MNDTSPSTCPPPCAAAARPLHAPAPIVVTAVALVTLGFCVAFALVAPLGAAAASSDPWSPAQADGVGRAIAFAVIGGILLGMPLAIHVLHRELARPLALGEAREDASASRFVYAPGARRRMMLGLAAAYGTAALLALLLARTTDAASALRALLAY
ncbi:MAG: hypothetical protein EHM87_15060 [Burkholderiales bacterium]|nr:MAG: hypothetical protein EHM87_15060 [Burkholderiales bacterium]